MATGGGGAAGGAAAAAGPVPVKVAIQPRRFSGELHECSKEFLDLFEEAALCNRWTPDVCALQFPNYLAQTAAKWWRSFKNERLRVAAAAGAAVIAPTWNEIKTHFQDAFSSVGDVVSAELKLDSRKQRGDDTPEQFVFDIISLCDRVDPGMSPERRVRFLLRNMKEWYLTKIMPLNPSTVDEVLTHLRRLSEMKRISERSLDRDLPMLSVLQEPSLSLEMREMVKQTQKLVEEIQEQRKEEKAQKEAEQQRRRQDARNTNTRCFSCNLEGHMARDCRRVPRGPAQFPISTRGGNEARGPRRVHFEDNNRGDVRWSGVPRAADNNRTWNQNAGNNMAGGMGRSPAPGGPNQARRF